MENGASPVTRSEASKVPAVAGFGFKLPRPIGYLLDISILLALSYIVNVQKIHRHRLRYY